MFKRFSAVALLVCFASVAQAGVFGSALIDVTDARVEWSNDGGLTYMDVTAANFNFATVPEPLASTKAEYGGSSQSFFDVPGFDAPQSSVNSPVGENVFVPQVPNGTAFARADTDGNPDLLSGANGIAIAELEASALDPGAGEAFANITDSFAFRINQGFEGLYRFKFSGMSELNAESISPPDGFVAKAQTEFRVQLNGGDANINDGESKLSASISGTDTYSESEFDYTTGSADLVQDVRYLLTINQIARVDLVAVPEPSSVLAFALIGGVGLVGRRRRRS